MRQEKIEIIVQNSTHIAILSLMKNRVRPRGQEFSVLMDKDTAEKFSPENFKSRLETVEKIQKILRGSK